MTDKAPLLMDRLRGSLPNRIPEWPWLLFWLAVLGLVLTPLLAGQARPTLDWLPGLPAQQEASREKFEEAFWPALYSGLVSGVVTGVVVGLVVGAFLQRTERRLQDRRQIEEHGEALARFRRVVRQYVRELDTSYLAPLSAIDAIPNGAKLIAEELQNQPTWIWRKQFGDQADFF